MFESNGNIANGGLAVNFRHQIVLSDFNRFWFMNTDGEFVYYSDGTNGHYLCHYNDSNPVGSVIVKKPCTNITLSGDWLYYINESDGRLYRCLKNGRSESVVIREKVSEYVIYGEDDIIYSTHARDIKCEKEIMAKGVSPSMLCIAGGKLFFANGSDGNYLSYIRLDGSDGFHTTRIGDFAATFINSNGRFVFYTDALKDNAIFRMPADGGSAVKICGESAGYLHIIEDKLYFWNGSLWKYIPLDGGVAMEA